ncbi:MAG TPA: thiamine pyrophosphate-dependent enzyme [Phycisphaerae bacterium]|nr:thiamine pyrophosphate-dependent enzyme [Phycisphaerae bacterium]
MNRITADLQKATTDNPAPTTSQKVPSTEVVPDWFRTAYLIRAVEQRLLALFAEGKLFGTVHTCIGQELSAVAVARALRPGDKIFSNHRCHGHFIAFTGNVSGLIAEIMGRQTGVCGGRGGSQHLCEEGFFSNGVQGSIAPVSAGLALAEKFKDSENIITVFLGDGTLGEGAVYETLNLASKWELPLLFVLENNLYAQSTSQKQTLAGDILARPQSFGIKTLHTSTWDTQHIFDMTAAAADFVRKNKRPAFICIDTFRLMAHSKGDDDRNPAELQEYWARDPLQLVLNNLTNQGAEIKAQADRQIDQAVAAANDAPWASADPPASANLTTLHWIPAPATTLDRCVVQIREALRRNMARDSRIILVGEDIESPYGGAFKATKGLSDEFPGRVRNTPISEAIVVGLGNGLALNGMIPVCEIMFGDFLMLAADQIVNSASKFRYMYNNKVRVPFILRTPMGGKRGYGPTHSQSLEKHFLGLPDVCVLALHHRLDPGIIYDELFREIAGPVLVIENKLMYSWRITSEPPEGFVIENSSDPFPTTRLRPATKNVDLTVVCYGGMLPEVEAAVIQAFERYEIACELVVPTQLYPLDIRPFVASVSRTARLLVVEEGLGFAAFGAELVARLTEVDCGLLSKIRRLASPEHPIPSSGPLEKSLLPNPDNILQAIAETVRS